MTDPIRIIRARRVEEGGARVEVEAHVFPPYRHPEMERKLEMTLPPEEEDAADQPDDDELFELWACDVRLPCDTKDRAIFGGDAAHALDLAVKFGKITLDLFGYVVEPSSPDAVPLDLANFSLTLVKTIRGRKVIDGETRYTSARIYAPHYHADFDMWFCPLQFPVLGKEMHQRTWGNDAAEAAETGEAKIMEYLAYHGVTILPEE